MIFLLDGGRAFYATLNLLVLPAAGMLVAGVVLWYRAHRQRLPQRVRAGKMLTMMGAILLVILLIISGFLQMLLSRQTGVAG
jgi:membrane-associated protease RseP (regulator of RpoE activity)